jgi:hypothetical protein
MLSEVKEYEALNSLIRDELLGLKARRAELKNRIDDSRKKWESVEHMPSRQEECTALIHSVRSVLAERKEFEARTVGPRKRLMDSLEKIPKRKVSKWRPVLAELNTENEKYFKEVIPALILLADRYENAVTELERYVNANT